MTDEESVKAKRRRTAAEILQIVRDFESSGLNVTQFCRERDLRRELLYR